MSCMNVWTLCVSSPQTLLERLQLVLGCLPAGLLDVQASWAIRLDSAPIYWHIGIYFASFHLFRFYFHSYSSIYFHFVCDYLPYCKLSKNIEQIKYAIFHFLYGLKFGKTLHFSLIAFQDFPHLITFIMLFSSSPPPPPILVQIHNYKNIPIITDSNTVFQYSNISYFT